MMKLFSRKKEKPSPGKAKNPPIKKQEPSKKYYNIGLPVKKLTEKEDLFVKYYVSLKFNGTQAAIKAGYSEKTAANIANQNLGKLHIKEAIHRRKRYVMNKAELTQDMVIQELRKVGFSDIKDYINIGSKGITIKDLQGIDTTALGSCSMRITKAGIQMDIKTHNKVHSLELLGKHFGTFNESNKFEIDLKNLKVSFANIDFEKKPA